MTSISAQLRGPLADRYRIERELGTGGMATVYLAEDLKHHRRVAIKVLKPELAAVIGAERFLSEIRTTATLQHPHVLALFDSGLASVDGHQSTVDGRPSTVDFLYYVMPFVEGESLRDRLTREKQLPIADAVRIATEVASALDYAHRHGVIHRDIKPENILLHDGSALVADFGIALAVSNTAGHRMTETGMSLGTPHYMSPEQAMGERDLDGRTDVYALGCVLYEMLTGEPPFTGPTAQAIVAKVMTATPEPVTTYRKTVSPAVEDAVLTALQKLPADRFASARDLAAALESSPSRPAVQASRRARHPGENRGERPSRRVGPWLTWASLAVAAGAVAVAAWSRISAPVPPETRYAVALPRHQDLALVMQGTHIAVAHDGSFMVYTGGDSLDGRLWIKPRNSLTATSIPGTEGAYDPFISPDNREIGFFADRNGRAMKIVTLAGGPPRSILQAPLGNSGAAWASDGYIYFDADRGGLQRVRPDGSGRETIVPLDTTQLETGIAWPQVLPGGRTVIVRLRHANDLPTDFTIIAVRISNGERRTLARAVSARYAAGRMLFVTADGTLQSAPFSESKLALKGPLSAVLDNVRIAGTYSGVDLDISDDGTLWYVAGQVGAGTQLIWVDRDGTERPVDPNWREDGEIRGVSLSPDGGAVALELSQVGSTGTDIWVKQLPAGPLSRLTTDPAPDSRPMWSRDARFIDYISERAHPMAIYRQPADGSGVPTIVMTAKYDVTEATESPDGRWVVAKTSVASPGFGDIVAMEADRDSMARPIIQSPAMEASPALSPDGKWLAYVSTTSGMREVYVRPFPDVGSRVWPVSTDGGREPRWSHSGRELFFRSLSSQDMMVADIETTPTFRASQPRPLFRTTALDGIDYVRYDVSPDDRHFLMVGRTDADERPQLIRIEQFAASLRRHADGPQ
jgi:serine/threonine-protein kinase